MWKKDETPDETTPPRREPSKGSAPRNLTREAGQQATIGRSIRIRGEVSGDEDLLIQGHVDGTVNLKQHALTVGAEGEVKADVTARLITVEGRVEGDLTADDQLILRGSAQVDGDLTAPRVVLEDGARFRGGIDMGEPAAEGRGKATAKPPSSATPGPEATGPGKSRTPSGTSPSKKDTDKEGSTSASSKEKDRTKAAKGTG